MKILKPVFLSLLSTSALILATGCNSGSNSTATVVANPTPTATPCTNCSAITPENFVAALVQLGQAGTIASGYANSTLTKANSLQANYFVIWDGETQSYQAVNISAYTTWNNNNPTTAAQGFASATPTNHYAVTSTTTTVNEIDPNPPASEICSGLCTIPEQSSSSSSVVNGTQYAGAFGTNGSVTSIPLQKTNQLDPQGNPTFQDPYSDGLLYSQADPTRDTDLQQSQLQQTSQLKRAAQLSAGLQMNFTSAVQLTQLADTIQMIQAKQTQLTSDDRAAVMQRMQGIAGVTSDELTQAIQGGMQGDMSASDAMIEKISTHLGMPAGTLKDKILPQLGVNL